MTFVGFDLHKRYITACALDESGAILAEIRQLSTALEAVLAWLTVVPRPVTVGMEATLSWEWLATRLATHGYTVRVAHAFHVKLIWQARAKTDPIDARKLAELLRVNLFPAIWLPDTDTRERRQLLRGRAFLVRERTRLKNRIHGHLMAENLVAPGSDLYGKGGRAWLDAAPLSPVLRMQTQRLLTLHDALTAEIVGLDAEVKKAAKGKPVVKQLTTMPGVGVFGALFLQAEIGSITRFHSSHELAAYAGLVPTTRSSGGKTAHGGLGKASNRWLKWILVEIVVTLKLAPGPVGSYYRHLLRAKGKPKAQAAAARKLCCYHRHAAISGRCGAPMRTSSIPSFNRARPMCSVETRSVVPQSPLAFLDRLPTLLERREVPSLALAAHHPQPALGRIERQPSPHRKLLDGVALPKVPLTEETGRIHGGGRSGRGSPHVRASVVPVA